jgi:hypothetical protein
VVTCLCCVCTVSCLSACESVTRLLRFDLLFRLAFRVTPGGDRDAPSLTPRPPPAPEPHVAATVPRASPRVDGSPLGGQGPACHSPSHP